MNPEASMGIRMKAVLTDMHFWVPVVVLVGGLLLLRMFH